jgi:uncharacterized membrane protein YccC
MSDIDLLGVRFAINIFVATTLLWLIIRSRQVDPIWAISSMIAASEPKVEEALKFFRGRLVNSLIGCATGLFILFVGGTSEWKIPLALSVSVLISTYVARVPVMWRQAPITATIVVAGGLLEVSKIQGLQQGLTRVGDVLLGCFVGLLVTFVISRLWPMESATEGEIHGRTETPERVDDTPQVNRQPVSRNAEQRTTAINGKGTV